jgi:hypothetical protein
MSNIGKRIHDFYCNGFAGRRYDLEGSIIESEGSDWIVIRTPDEEPVFLDLRGWDKQENIDEWTK